MIRSWFSPCTETLKRNVCKYFLQKCLGQFLREKLNYEQLAGVSIKNGEVALKNLYIDIQAVNKLGESYNVPIDLVDGLIESITVHIPWMSILRESIVIEIRGLHLTVKPKQRMENVSMFDSMWGSMTTSMQMAQECLQQQPECEKEIESAPTLDGLEKFAQIIESVLKRIKFRFSDTVIRVEHVPKYTSVGVALEIHIEKMDFFDEIAVQDPSGERLSERNIYEPASFSIKNFLLEGTNIYLQEFSLNDVVGKLETLSVSPSSPEMPPQHLRLLQERAPESEMLSKPVLVSTILGEQEIRLTLKQNEVVPGPKVGVEFGFGHFTFLLCPKQVHMLFQLFEGLSSSDAEDQSGRTYSSASGKNKPMEAADYAVIEEELQKQLLLPSVPSRSLQQQRGWSSHSLGEESDEEFLPMSQTRKGNKVPESTTTHSEMDTSFSSTVSSTTVTSYQSGDSGSFRRSSLHSRPRSHRQRGSVQGIVEDTPTELTQFKVNLESLIVLVLHEDVSPTPISLEQENLAAGASVHNDNNLHMQMRAENFFDSLTKLLMQKDASKQVTVSREELSQICPYNHLRFVASNFKLEGDEKSCASQWWLSFLLTIEQQLEVLECLFVKKNGGDGSGPSIVVPSYSELLTFSENALKLNGSPIPPYADPFFSMKYEHRERASQSYSIVHPVTSISFQLAPFWTEVDMSIVERIVALIKPFLQRRDEKQKDLYTSAIWELEDHSLSLTERSEIRISSPFAVVCFCFPVPDLRPVHDKERVPWWQRNLRKEKLIIELTSATCNVTMENSDKETCIELQWKDGHVFLQETPSSIPVSFLRTTAETTPNSTLKEDGFDWPRLVIKIHPVVYPSVLEAEHSNGKDDNLPSNSIDAFMLEMEEAQCSLFATRQVVSETDSSFGGIEDADNPQKTTTETDELLMPADKKNISDFIEKTLANTHLSFEFSLPTLNVVIPNKHFFEVLYNRLGSDVPLWEPVVYFMEHAEQSDSVMGPALDIASQLRNANFQEFSMCKSGLQYDSSSDSEEGSTVYYSVYDPRLRKRRKDHLLSKTQSYLVINVVANKAKFTIFPPLRDTLGNVIPEQCGEIQAHAEDGSFFAVSCFQGDPKVNYMCVQSNKASMYHKSVSSFPESMKRVEPLVLEPPKHLTPTLYHCEPGVPHTGMPIGVGGDSADMFTVSIKLGIDEEQALKVKTFGVAVGLRGMTLCHQMTQNTHSWVSQLVDFIQVTDYPIAGYIPPSVVTELSLQLWSCSVDYRPLYLPLRTFLTVENFSISSNLPAKTSVTATRMIFEEMCLFLSKKVDSKYVDLKKDYVCVLETGLVDLSMRVSEEKNPNVPWQDMKASNDIIHIRVCADSMQAFKDLLNYFASDGDLVLGMPSGERRGSQDPLLFAQASDDRSPIINVHSLMEDAMREDFVSASDGSDSEDEKQVAAEFPETTTTTTTTLPLQTIANHYAADDDDDYDDGRNSNDFVDEDLNNEPDNLSIDEEFCILEDYPGVGIMLKNGEPSVRTLTSESIRINDNHFALPMGKSDQLRAPRHYPNPVKRYTLKEMTLVVHFYGGNDFEPVKGDATKETKKAKTVKIIDENEDRKKPMYAMSSSPSHRSRMEQASLNPERCGISFNKNYEELQWTSIHAAELPPESERTCNPLSWRSKGGRGRKHDVLMQLHMNKMRFQHEVYPDNTEQASRQVLLIHSVEVLDRLESSKINKFLYHYTSEALPQQSRANMVEIKALHVRPSQTLPAQECSLRVSLRPLRLNIDQDALLFLWNFFNEVANLSEASSDLALGSTTFHQTPVMGFASANENLENLQHELEQQSLIMFQDLGLDEGKSEEMFEPDGDDLSQTGSSGMVANTPIFFRSFVFSPEVPIRLDYHGKHIDMEQGALAGLIMGLGQLNCSELHLKRLCHFRGIKGFNRLLEYALAEWMNDIRKNQLPNLLGGVGPIRSFVQLFQGIRDLIWMPIEQYRKDGRIVRGLQKGASSFSTSTANAVLELTNRVVLSLKSCCEFTYDMVSPGPSVKTRALVRPRWQRNMQPADIREGVTNAYHVVREGLGDTARRIVRVAAQEHEHKGVSGAVGGILRQIPPTVVQPLILATEATSNVLDGMRNQLVPDAHREAVEKWRPTVKRY